MKLSAVLIAALALAGCAGLNPNVGTRTADEAYQRGDCTTALDIYKKNAETGKPWAQMRLGLVYYEGRCVPKDDVIAMTWLKKAGAYESKSDWEKGKEFSTGEYGFFNTRASASNASRLISIMYQNGAGVVKDLTKAWLWGNRGLALANAEDKGRVEGERRAIELNMTDEELSNAKHLALTWTGNDTP